MCSACTSGVPGFDHGPRQTSSVPTRAEPARQGSLPHKKHALLAFSSAQGAACTTPWAPSAWAPCTGATAEVHCNRGSNLSAAEMEDLPASSAAHILHLGR